MADESAAGRQRTMRILGRYGTGYAVWGEPPVEGWREAIGLRATCA